MATFVNGRWIVSILTALSLLATLVACSAPWQGETMNSRQLQQELNEHSGGVFTAHVSEERSGLSKNLVVVVQLRGRSLGLTVETVRAALTITSNHTPSDYPGVVVVAFTNDEFEAVDAGRVVTQAGVPDRYITLGETLHFADPHDLETLVESW